jgi:antitoxin CcdA
MIRTMLTKRPINLTLTTGTLDAAKRLGINISQVCDDYLRQFVREEQERRWRQEHAGFVAAYNATLEAEDLPLAEWRTF